MPMSILKRRYTILEALAGAEREVTGGLMTRTDIDERRLDLATHGLRDGAPRVESASGGDVRWIRHVPAKIIRVADIPRTKSGKIVELAVRSVVHGESVQNKEALANPEALELFKDLDELKS